ncbi:L,D-transpeptidase family protein [Sphingopyxis lindanitolerans]|uniref:L,D-transpeptidase family protein n=1 Tax=Sphingopyxis lindanitolerans TaxID=2054227 RepID=UPI001F5BF050|nr:L,D-transpeptidase family protein [Sphingopyxis lindanitolerans]
MSASLAAGIPVAVTARAAPTAVAVGGIAAAIRAEAGGDLKHFYAARDFRPLWVRAGKTGPAAQTLLAYLESADLDGLKPSSYEPDRLREMIRDANRGDAQAQARAELALSKAFARYVGDMRRPERDRTIYADKSLKPKKPSALAVLRAAAFPKNFDAYLAGMDWMSEHYGRLRGLVARAEKQGASRETLARLHRNLDRTRILPGPWVHHIVVDASSGQLWYYGSGKRQGSMRVVVGAAKTQTPLLAGKLQWAILNPYWNVPTYLARDSIAQKILGGRSLASLHMEALSDWGPNPAKIDPATIDWHAVAAGKEEIRLRELPGAGNSMGRVKFLFPNKEGIYLHDTPDRALLAKPDRHFSNGCIRLENAGELGRWLMQRPLKAPSNKPEQAVPLPAEVPVYLTYITAVATERGVAFRDDIYGRDG